MAAITSAQAGNWWTASTWTGGVIPGHDSNTDQDTVTINHAVTLDQNTIIGNSPVTDTAVVSVSATAGASLTINNGITFRVRGGLTLTSNNLTVGSGCTVIFDSSLSASPSTTKYRLYFGANSTAANVYINGTSGARTTLTAETASAALGWHISVAGGVNGDFIATYTDFSNMSGNAANRAITHSPGAAKTFRLDHCTTSNIGYLIYVGAGSTVTSSIEYLYTYFSPAGGLESNLCLYLLGPVPTTGTRKLTNCFVGGVLSNASPTTFEGWTLDNSILTRANFVAVSPVAAPNASGKNVTIVANIGTSTAFAISNSSLNLEDFFLLHNTYANNSTHFTGAIGYSADLSILDGVIESSNGSPSDNVIHAPIANTTDPVDRAYTTTQRNNIFAYNAAGYSSGRPFQFKSAYTRQFNFDNNTLPLMYSQSPAAGAISHGTNSTNHPGMLQSAKNNLCFKPDSYTSVTDRTWLVKVAQQAVISGTAGGTSTTTSLVAGSSLFQTGAIAPVGHTVKITSGPDAGMKRAVTAGVSATTLTVVAFPNTMAGQTFEVYGVDSVVDTGADYNAFYGARAEGTIYDSDNVSSRTSVTGYGDFRVTTPANIGAHDLILTAAPRFREDTRTIARFSIDYLNNAVGTAWATATAYAVGDIRSRAVTGFYGGRTVNYRCIKAHTSGTAYDLPGEFTGTSTDNWRLFWEFESMYEIRNAQTQIPGYNPLAVQANYLAWMREGFTPSDMVLATAGASGTYIGAVMPADDYKAAGMLMGM